MNSIINHVSPTSSSQRILSPKQFDLLASSEGHELGRSASSVLDIKIMYSSLYITYTELCKTCQPSSKWNVASNVYFVSKAEKFLSELERCIHMGVTRSKVMRDAIVLMVGIGETTVFRGDSNDSQDWDKIMGEKFFDWMAYRASCVGNEVIGMTDEMYCVLNENSGGDLVSKTREVLMFPLSDMSSRSGFVQDLILARTCYSIAHRSRSIVRGNGSRMRDVARVLEAVLGEWVVGQSC